MCKKRGPGNKLRMFYSLPAGGVGGHDRLGHVVDPHQVLEKEKKNCGVMGHDSRRNMHAYTQTMCEVAHGISRALPCAP